MTTKPTDAEIKKALECCRHPLSRCEDCPIIKGGFCFDHLKIEALDLINRLKAENERLKEANQTIDGYNGKLRNLVTERDIEIERLKREIENIESVQEITPEAKHFIDTKADKVISLMNEIIKSQDQIKAEAIKEFAERLKDNKYETSVDAYTTGYLLGEEDIDNLVKEMVGEDENDI